jgi:hypothetical protein
MSIQSKLIAMLVLCIIASVAAGFLSGGKALRSTAINRLVELRQSQNVTHFEYRDALPAGVRT